MKIQNIALKPAIMILLRLRRSSRFRKRFYDICKKAKTTDDTGLSVLREKANVEHCIFLEEYHRYKYYFKPEMIASLQKHNDIHSQWKSIL